MKLVIILSTIFLIGVFLFTGCVSKNPEQKFDNLVFKTTLREAPQKFKGTDTYFLDFDTIDVVNDKNDVIKNSFENGGTLVLTGNKLPKNAKIDKNTKIVVHLKENFATTASIPPQILEDSVIKVEFNL